MSFNVFFSDEMQLKALITPPATCCDTSHLYSSTVGCVYLPEATVKRNWCEARSLCLANHLDLFDASDSQMLSALGSYLNTCLLPLNLDEICSIINTRVSCSESHKNCSYKIIGLNHT